MTGYDVENVRRESSPDGGEYWVADLVVEGSRYRVESRGGWTLVVGDDRRHLLPEVAEFVADHVPRSERARRR
jgi:hypothetical protein